MTVAELLGRISSRELSEWLAYAQVEPFGPERADLRAGIIAATVANAHRDKKKKARPYQAKDFTPRFGQRRERSPETLLQKVEMINALLGGKDLRTNRE